VSDDDQCEYDDDDDEENADESSTEFDRNLPSAHSYLGTLSRVSSSESGAAARRNTFASRRSSYKFSEGSMVSLPLFLLDVVLFPNQTLPLRVFENRYLSMIDEITADGGTRTFGVLFVQRALNRTVLVAEYGCTARLEQLGEAERGVGESRVLSVLSRGAQRFHVERVWADPNGLARARVVILPTQCADRAPSAARQRLAHLDRWVYSRYDAGGAYRRVVNMCAAANMLDDSAPVDSAESLSFWLANALPLSSDARQRLLDIDSLAERLRTLADILSSAMIMLSCARCGCRIARQADVFRMSSGSDAFVNEDGHVHETITTRRASRYRLDDDAAPETNFSWFKGYAWQLIYCQRCDAHLGWRFTASPLPLRPSSFFGLRRASIQSTTRNK
jgi:Lon protease-like protein